MVQTLEKVRFEFVDWMKVIGMFVIILGHFAPPDLQSLVYSFSVQLFFLISGFLFHVEDNGKNFWKKNIRSLLVPYLIWGTFRLIAFNIKYFDVAILWRSFLGMFLGCNNFMGVRGCGELWFVATLLFLKVILQYGRNMKFVYFFFVVSLFAAFLYCRLIAGSELEYMGFALGNVFVAYPFFCLGYLLARRYKPLVIKLSSYCEKFTLVASMAMGIILLMMWNAVNCNGVVLMVYGQYGRSLALYLLFGIIGILFAFLLSTILKRMIFKEFAYIINIGSIMILGVHTMMITLTKPILIKYFDGKSCALDFFMALASLVILCMFVPVIKFAMRFAPIVLGSRGKV